MRHFLCLFFVVLVVSGCKSAMDFKPPPAQTAQEKADVRVTEQHFSAEREATRLWQKAEDRARAAIMRSSAGDEWIAVAKEYQDAKFQWEYSYKGGRMDSLGEVLFNAMFVDRYKAARSRYHEAKQKYESLRKDMRRTLYRMTAEFLEDEIRKIRERKQDSLLGKLRRLMKKKKAEMTL